MGVIVNKENSMNDGLSRRIDADLRAKMEGSQKPVGRKKDVDLAEDSEYVQNFEQTSRFGWLWVVLVVVAVGVLIAVGLSHG